MTMKKITALFLALVMLVLVAVGCANTEDTPDAADTTTATPTQNADTTVPSDTSSSEGDELSGFVKDEIPADARLDGKTITLLHWDNAGKQEFFSEGQSGEIVNDAIYSRNLTVEDRLGVMLAFASSPGKYEEQDVFIKKAENDITSGACEYDAFATYSMTIASAAYNGMATDLRQFDILDFEKPWWPDTLLNESTIYDKLYFASGDISTNLLYMMYGCFFNKSILDDHGLENPYELVYNNQWTMDKMFEMSENIYNDANGDSAIGVEDVFAFSTTTYVHLDPFYYAAGLKTMDNNADGTPVVSPDFSSEKAIDVVNKVRAYLNDGNYANYQDGNKIFQDGRSLFIFDRVQYAENNLKDATFEYGMVPAPKYDSAQENFSTVLGFGYTLYCISNGSKDPEGTALVMECMASESYRQVTPVFFETCMKYKYASDNDTSRMYDILRDTVSFDIGRIFTMSFNKITYQYFRNCVRSATPTNYATAVKGQIKSLERLVDKFAETFASFN